MTRALRILTTFWLYWSFSMHIGPHVLVDASRQLRWHQAPIAAAIFGSRSTQCSRQSANNLQSFARGGSEQLPPPPPPPPPTTEHRNDALLRPPRPPTHSKVEANHSNPNPIDMTPPPPPPPPLPLDYWGYPIPPEEWNAWEQEQQPPNTPSPYMEDGWVNLSPQQQKYDSQQYATGQYYLEQDLQVSLQRQQELLQQAQNLTATIVMLEQREELHLRQLDVLTERVLQVENSAAHERNLIVEYQGNCTALSLQVQSLESDVEQWRWRCQELVNQTQQDAKEIAALKKEKKAALLEAEDLAAMIEKHRLSESEGDEVYSSSKRKKRGFFAWLFGWGSETTEDADLEDVYTSARSTLLAALQSERNSVHELETAVNSLQQNNSAISEQVKSRDLIIDELNDRIAVFEEDKLVLKAALKQLQKDLNTEAPKTQKLMDDLERSKKEIARLKKEIKALIDTHQGEVAALRETISAKEDSIHQTESNLTVIGTYVDRLEARLAEFAIARRDIEARETKCLEIEKLVEKTTREREELNARILELESEKDEVKTLLQELATERARLRSSNQDLKNEVRSLKDHESRLRESLSSLNNDYGELVTANMELQHKLESYEHKQKDDIESSSHLRGLLNQTDAKLGEIQKQLQHALTEREQLFAQLLEAKARATEIQHRLVLAESENAQLQQSYRLLQEEGASSLQSNRSHTISRDAFSIHLLDVKPQVRQLACKVVPTLGFGATIALSVQPPTQRIEEPIKQAANETMSRPGSTSNPLRSSNQGTNQLPPSAVTGTKGATTRVPTDKVVSKVNQNRATPASGTLRSIRKAFAKATGLHGTFTKNYKTNARRTLPQHPPPIMTAKSASVQLHPQRQKHVRGVEPYNAAARALPTHPLKRTPPIASIAPTTFLPPAQSSMSSGVPKLGRPKSSSTSAPKTDQRLQGAESTAAGAKSVAGHGERTPGPPSLPKSPDGPALAVLKSSSQEARVNENGMRPPCETHRKDPSAHPSRASAAALPPTAANQVTVPSPPVFVMPSDQK